MGYRASDISHCKQKPDIGINESVALLLHSQESYRDGTNREVSKSGYLNELATTNKMHNSVNATS